MLASASLLFGAWSCEAPPDAAPVVETTAETSAPTPEASHPQEPEPHPVSLEAFSRTPFDGWGLALGPVLASNEAYVRHYVTYRSGTLRISGIMNIPRGDGPFPLLVLNHGYIDPAVYTNGRGLKREQDYLARAGYAVLHTDYRNHAESDDDPDAELRLRLGYAEDAVNAVLAVREAKLPNVDASRAGMLGHSMGGGVTLQVATSTAGIIDAAVLFAPVSADARDNFRRWTERRPEIAEKIRAAYGGPEKNPAFWQGVSPKSRLDRIVVPVMLHHGTADESTPHEWAVALDAAMKDAQKPMTFHSYEGEPHEFARAWPTVMARTVDFFDAHLRDR